MIELELCPIAFSIGPFEIRWYGIMVVLAVIAILVISTLEARRVHLDEDHIYNLGVWAVIGGILFSRVIHVIDKWSYYMENPTQIFNFEGLAVYGAVIGVIIAIVAYCRVKKLSILQIADLVSPGALVGMAIGRIGCVFNGCCYGLVTDLPWGVVYECPTSYAPQGIPLQPTQEYHIIWNLFAFGVLWVLRKHLKPQGSTFLLYLAFYAAGDLLIRTFREGDAFLFGLQQAQVIGIIILLIVIPLFVVRMVLAKKKEKNGH
jgi:phosphatidylglycerol---prolipoprotein diacylglyceryl transferase